MGADFDGSGGTPCRPLGSPPAGKYVESELVAARDGHEWVARPAFPGDTLEVRLYDDGPDAPSSGRRVAGTMRGRVADRGAGPCRSW